MGKHPSAVSPVWGWQRANSASLQVILKIIHCNENPIFVFLFWELHGLRPNFQIHVSVSDLYIPRIGPHTSCSRIGRSTVGIYKTCSQTHESRNWDCGREIPFLEIFVSNFRYQFFAVQWEFKQANTTYQFINHEGIGYISLRCHHAFNHIFIYGPLSVFRPVIFLPVVLSYLRNAELFFMFK